MFNNDFFIEFKNKHANQSLVFFGSGPSLARVDLSKISPHHLRGGLNQQIFLENLALDYWFQGDAAKQDLTRFYDRYEEYQAYKPNIQKFVRFCNWDLDAPVKYYKGLPVKQNGQTPLNMKGAIYYNAKGVGNTKDCVFSKNLDTDNAMTSQRSITFEALQFFLYCGFTKIYLVGHDCDYSEGAGTFDGCRIGKSLNAGYYIFDYWKVVVPWIDQNYSNVELIWVNPTDSVRTAFGESPNVSFEQRGDLYE